MRLSQRLQIREQRSSRKCVLLKKACQVWRVKNDEGSHDSHSDVSMLRVWWCHGSSTGEGGLYWDKTRDKAIGSTESERQEWTDGQPVLNDKLKTDHILRICDTQLWAMAINLYSEQDICTCLHGGRATVKMKVHLMFCTTTQFWRGQPHSKWAVLWNQFVEVAQISTLQGYTS